jgi:parvulin-like peptidyl-prolyl isomerase
MEAIWQRVTTGQDFAALATQSDEGLARYQKGFGTGEKRGEIAPLDLEETVWALKPGQMSVVVQTATGYHLVKVVERDYAGVRPFDAKIQAEIREKLNDAMYEADRAKLIEDLWRKGVVRVLHD